MIEKGLVVDFLNDFIFFVEENEKINTELKNMFYAMKNDFLVSFISFFNISSELLITITEKSKESWFALDIRCDCCCFNTEFEYKREIDIRRVLRKNREKIINVVKFWIYGIYEK